MREKTRVNLRDITRQIQAGSPALERYLNKKTFETLMFLNGEDMGGGRRSYEDISHSPDYIKIPGREAIHESDLMKSFAQETIRNVRVRASLLDTIRKETPHSVFLCNLPPNVRRQYENFYKAYLLQLAREWCQANGIPYDRDRVNYSAVGRRSRMRGERRPPGRPALLDE